MANKFNKNRYNKLLSYRNNYYANGGETYQWGNNDLFEWPNDFLRSLNPDVKETSLDTPLNVPKANISDFINRYVPSFGDVDIDNNIGSLSLDKLPSSLPKESSFNKLINSDITKTVAPALGGVVGGVIGGNLSSGVGSALNGLSNIASAIPGPWGTIASTGLKVASGLTNRMFGSKLNQGNINNVEGTINKLNNFQSNASNFDTLANNWSATNLGTSFTNNYIGSDGLFSNKAKNKANQLRQDLSNASLFAENSLLNNADTLKGTMKRNLEANYAATGGFLHHYANGGDLETNGSNFPTGLTFINEGGTHEENPYSGVPMGVGPTGKPNLVEEGEVVYNDYVFSNRLNVPSAIRNKYKLRGNKEITFADAAKQLSKNVTERPNDSISRDTLKETMADLALAQEGVRGESPNGNKFAKGGNTYNTYGYVNGYNNGWFDDKGNYRQDYLDKVNNMAIQDFNKALNDQYAFYSNDKNKGSDRWNAIDKFYAANPQYKTNNNNLTDDQFNLAKQLAHDGKPGYMHQIFLDASTPTINRANRYFLRGKDAKGNPTVTPLPVTPWKGLNSNGQTFNEAYPNYNFVGEQERPIDKGTIYTDYYYNENKPKVKKDISPIDLGTSNEWLRYAPVVGLGLPSLTDALGITNNPDYDEAGMIDAYSRRAIPSLVSWNPIGNQIANNPFDIDYLTNKLNAQSSATRRAIANQSGGNSGRAIAGILASDYLAQNAIGDEFRKSLEYNLGNKYKSEEFNRGTNQANAQGELQADMANQQALANIRDFGLRGVLASAEMRQKAKLAADQARSANLSGLFQTLGDIGYENKGMNMIRRLAETGALGVLSDPMIQYAATNKAYNNYKKNKNLTKES